MDLAVFFPDRDGRSSGYREAKKVCGRCSVRDECLDHALLADEAHGVWGGLAPSERHIDWES